LSFGPAEPGFPDEPLLLLLAGCPLFSGLPEQALRELAGRAHLRRYEAEQALYRHGGPERLGLRALLGSRSGQDQIE